MWNIFASDYEEFDEIPDFDENDGELIPLNNRFDYPEKTDGGDEVDGTETGVIPAGYFPQPNHYPPVSFLSIQMKPEPNYTASSLATTTRNSKFKSLSAKEVLGTGNAGFGASLR